MQEWFKLTEDELYTEQTQNFVYIPLYDLDIDVLRQMSGFSWINSRPYWNLGNSAPYNAYHYGVFCVSNNASVKNALSEDTPKSYEDSGAIFTSSGIMTLQDGVYKETDKIIEEIPFGSPFPSDWYSSGHYLTKVITTVGNNSIEVYNTVGDNQSYYPTQQYYKDVTQDASKRITRHLYFLSGENLCLQQAIYSRQDIWSGSRYRKGAYIGINGCGNYWYNQLPFEMHVRIGSNENYLGYDNSDLEGNHPAAYYVNRNEADADIVTPYKGCIFAFRMTYDNENFVGFACLHYDSDKNTPTYIYGCFFSRAMVESSITNEPPTPTPTEPEWGDNSGAAGGNGTFTAPSDDVSGNDVFDMTTGTGEMYIRQHTANNAWLCGFNIFKLGTFTALQAPDEIIHVIATLYGQNFFDKFKNSMYNPLSSVLSYHILPANLVGEQSSQKFDLTAGGFNVTENMSVTQYQFYRVGAQKSYNVGSVNISNFYGAYPDFAPYTRMILHLPYIGECELDTNAVMYGSIDIRYLCDVASGNIAAWIFCKDRNGRERNKYMLTGNAAYSFPLYAQSQDGSAMGKILAGAASAAAGIAIGNVGTITAGVKDVISGTAEQATLQRHTQHTGSLSGQASWISDSSCWLEIIRPCWVQPENYQALQGITSFIAGTLSDFAGGFVQADSIELENCTATAAEIEEIEAALKDGIYYFPAENV